MNNLYYKKTLYIVFILVYVFSNSQEFQLRNIKKLTFGGDNAEAYFSPNNQLLTLQVTNPNIGANCDQIYLLDLNTAKGNSDDLQLISTGLGRTTCSFFMPDGKHILYASTHQANEACPPKPTPRKDGKYLWPIYDTFDIYISNLKGEIVKKLTDSPGYDAEAVVSPDGKYIVFTSIRSGDLELWRMDIDGNNLLQLTFGLGYDGGAFFSHDSKKLVFRASRPKTPKEITEYKELLSQNLVAPTEMEIYTMDIDGKNLKQITQLGKANWSPYFHPSDKKILFSSNHHSTRGYDFQIYSIDVDGKNLRQITYESEFNAFPMFSPDGKKLVFSSNRNASKSHETNIFIADWVETDPAENIQTERLKNAINFLASDDLQGRLAGSKNEKKAARFIEKILKKAGAKTSFQTFDYSVKINPHHEASSKKNKGLNVIGFLDNKSSKTIVIGAHYDHLGLNEHQHSTLANANGLIHNGADDNASGVAAVLELATIFGKNKTKENVNFVFVLFSAEEDGLFGSKYFTESMKDKYPNIITMINLDMVGRLNKDKVLNIGGIGSSPIFKSILEKYKPAGFNLALDESGIGPSDHTSFYLKDIPVLFFFTGTHEDYHKPSDDTEKINFEGLKIISNYVFGVIKELTSFSEIPFTKTKTTTSNTVPKYKVTLGVMPSYADSTDGMKIDGVTDGRPASIAGVQAGDVLVKMGDCNIKEVYSYMQCLSKYNLGDETTIVVKRNGEELSMNVKF